MAGWREPAGDRASIGAGAAKPMPRCQPGPSLEQPGPTVARLAPYEAQVAQVAQWLREDRLKLTRIQDLLGQQGMVVTYTTLRRFVRQQATHWCREVAGQHVHGTTRQRDVG